MILVKEFGLERSRYQRLVTEEDYLELGIKLYLDPRPVQILLDEYRQKLVRESLRIVSGTDLRTDCN